MHKMFKLHQLRPQHHTRLLRPSTGCWASKRFKLDEKVRQFSSTTVITTNNHDDNNSQWNGDSAERRFGSRSNSSSSRRRRRRQYGIGDSWMKGSLLRHEQQQEQQHHSHQQQQIRGFAKWSRFRVVDAIRENARRREKLRYDEEIEREGSEPTWEYIQETKRKSPGRKTLGRNPKAKLNEQPQVIKKRGGKVNLGRKSVVKGFEELELLESFEPDLSPRVQIAHRNQLKKGIPEPTEAGEETQSSRKKRKWETALMERLGQALVEREIFSLDQEVRELLQDEWAVLDITKIELTKDFQICRVYWLPPFQTEMITWAHVVELGRILERHKGKIRHIFAKRLKKSFTPQIEVKYDKYEEVALRKAAKSHYQKTPLEDEKNNFVDSIELDSIELGGQEESAGVDNFVDEDDDPETFLEQFDSSEFEQEFEQHLKNKGLGSSNSNLPKLDPIDPNGPSVNDELEFMRQRFLQLEENKTKEVEAKRIQEENIIDVDSDEEFKRVFMEQMMNQGNSSENNGADQDFEKSLEELLRSLDDSDVPEKGHEKESADDFDLENLDPQAEADFEKAFGEMMEQMHGKEDQEPGLEKKNFDLDNLDPETDAEFEKAFQEMLKQMHGKEEQEGEEDQGLETKNFDLENVDPKTDAEFEKAFQEMLKQMEGGDEMSNLRNDDDDDDEEDEFSFEEFQELDDDQKDKFFEALMEIQKEHNDKTKKK